MSDTRIKDIATTATAAADDDYLVIDGATNGTRKILSAKVGGGSPYTFKFYPTATGNYNNRVNYSIRVDDVDLSQYTTDQLADITCSWSRYDEATGFILAQTAYEYFTSWSTNPSGWKFLTYNFYFYNGSFSYNTTIYNSIVTGAEVVIHTGIPIEGTITVVQSM